MWSISLPAADLEREAVRPRTTARAGFPCRQSYGVGFLQLPGRDTGDLLRLSVPGIRDDQIRQLGRRGDVVLFPRIRCFILTGSILVYIVFVFVVFYMVITEYRETSTSNGQSRHNSMNLITAAWQLRDINIAAGIFIYGGVTMVILYFVMLLVDRIANRKLDARVAAHIADRKPAPAVLEEVETVNLPVWSLCYLFYGDGSALTDEDMAQADTWEASYGAPITIAADENEEFEPFPEFGLACDCVKASIYRHHT